MFTISKLNTAHLPQLLPTQKLKEACGILNTTAQHRFNFFSNATIQVWTELTFLPFWIHTKEATARSTHVLNSLSQRG